MSHDDILTQWWKDMLQVEVYLRHTYICNFASFYGFHILLKNQRILNVCLSYWVEIKLFFFVKVALTIRFCAYLNTLRHNETLFVSALEINVYSLLYAMPVIEQYTY